MDVHVKLDLAASRGEREVDPKDCQAIVGSLMYIVLATRPDISYAVSALSRYNSRPFTSRLTAAKRVLRYLKATATTAYTSAAATASSTTASSAATAAEASATATAAVETAAVAAESPRATRIRIGQTTAMIASRRAATSS